MHRTLDVVSCACSCKGSRLNIHHILDLVLHAQQKRSRSRIYRRGYTVVLMFLLRMQLHRNQVKVKSRRSFNVVILRMHLQENEEGQGQGYNVSTTSAESLRSRILASDRENISRKMPYITETGLVHEVLWSLRHSMKR